MTLKLIKWRTQTIILSILFVLNGSFNVSFTDRENASTDEHTFTNENIYADEITFDTETYNEKAQELQIRLTVLGYKDSNGQTVESDGYFGDASIETLSHFLKAHGFSYYGSKAQFWILRISEEYVNLADRILLKPLEYSEKAEYYQLCLNRLGYKTFNNTEIETDGHFGAASMSALSHFLKDHQFLYFNTAAENQLIHLAEESVNKTHNTGFDPKSQGLFAVPFIFGAISNIDENHDPFYSMEKLYNFEYLITSRPDKLTYKSKRVVEFIKANTKIFGYVNLGPDNPYDEPTSWVKADMSILYSEVDSIKEAGWYGVYIDQFGYDFNETRLRQNRLVDYIHSKGLTCFVNAWHPEDVFDSLINKANPHGLAPHINAKDYVLIESFYQSDETHGFHDMDKLLKVVKYKEAIGAKIVTLTYKNNRLDWIDASEDNAVAFILTQLLGFDGYWFWDGESDDFLEYGVDPKIDIGKVDSVNMKQISENVYTAETTAYHITLDFRFKTFIQFDSKGGGYKSFSIGQNPRE